MTDQIKFLFAKDFVKEKTEKCESCNIFFKKINTVIITNDDIKENKTELIEKKICDSCETNFNEDAKFAKDFLNKFLKNKIDSEVEELAEINSEANTCFVCDQPMLDHDDPLYKTDNDILRCRKCYDELMTPIECYIENVKTYLNNIIHNINNGTNTTNTKYIGVQLSHFVELKRMISKFEHSLKGYSINDCLESIENIKTFRSKYIHTSKKIMEDINYKHVWQNLQQIKLYLMHQS